ncbi:hypothetical protein BGZ58_010174 [Dissophora ornata]|nr:hypothetical protein BGZ58_010174 [Dissophora ornata]
MAQLRSLHLDRPTTVPDSYVSHTTLFIQQNQATFPRKPKLDLEFEYGWHAYDDEDDDEDNIDAYIGLDFKTREAIQKARIKAQRERLFRFMRPKILLYEAVGQPRTIKVDEIPFFYKHAQRIGLDRLREFRDEDLDRIDQGEGLEMQAFLRRSENMRHLTLGAGDPNLLSWAAVEAMEASGLDPSILSINGPELSIAPPENLWHLSQRSPSELNIRFGNVTAERLRPYSGSDDKPPPTHEGSEVPIDCRYQQAELNFDLFSTWSLPKLKKLDLNDMAALRFDFRSLETMMQLESLSLCVGKNAATLQEEWKFRQKQSAWKVNNRRMDLFKGWSLPALKKLTLAGAPATMFFLEWLKECPSLEELSLTISGGAQHIHRRSFFPGPDELGDEKKEERKGSKKPKAEAVGDDDDDDDEIPFWDSHLAKFQLQGLWVMSEDDLTSLLAIYAPFLEEVNVGRLHEQATLNGYHFLNAIKLADEINSIRADHRRRQQL